MIASVLVLGDHSLRFRGITLVFAPGGVSNPAVCVAVTPAVDKQVLVTVGHVTFLAVFALESLDHPAGGHPVKQPQPSEERLCLRGLAG